MALRKCPACKNQVAAESESCPICGCNPRTHFVRKLFFWGAATAALAVMLQGTVRQHLSALHAPGPAPAQTAVSTR
jgi:hypothetical protein